MENASKALLIAGGVLITVLVVTLGLYILNTFGDYSAKVYQDMEQHEKQEFNSKFLKYDGATDLTMQDVITIMNLARDNNQRYELDEYEDNNYYINVSGTVDSITNLSGVTSNDIKLEDILKENNSDYEEKCKFLLKRYNDNNGASYVTEDEGGVQITKRNISFSCKVIVDNNLQLVKTINITKNT